jgi:hypothetical protein
MRISAPETTVSVGATVVANAAAMTKLNTSIDKLADSIISTCEPQEGRQADHLVDIIERLTNALDEQDRATGRYL